MAQKSKLKIQNAIMAESESGQPTTNNQQRITNNE